MTTITEHFTTTEISQMNKAVWDVSKDFKVIGDPVRTIPGFPIMYSLAVLAYKGNAVCQFDSQFELSMGDLTFDTVVMLQVKGLAGQQRKRFNMMDIAEIILTDIKPYIIDSREAEEAKKVEPRFYINIAPLLPWLASSDTYVRTVLYDGSGEEEGILDITQIEALTLGDNLDDDEWYATYTRSEIDILEEYTHEDFSHMLEEREED